MLSAASVQSEFRTSSDDWFTRSKLFLLLAACVVTIFPSVVIGSHSFFYRDMGLFSYPLAQFYREGFWRGEMPLWNPFNNCGIPFLAQWNTLTLYPGALIYLLLPLPWSMNLFVLAHLFLAAAGMYALAFRWTESRFGASVAGLVFAWNGLTLHALMWPHIIAALAWMPWLVLAVEQAWKHGGRRVAISALIGAMQMLTGAPEIILLTWAIAVVLCISAGSNPQKSDHSARVSLGRRLGRLFLCAAIVFALSAAQLLPFLDFLRHSNRDAAFGGVSWAMPLWGWVNFLVPLFGCTPSVVGVYSQDAQQWVSSYYLGIGTIALIPLALLAKDRRAKCLMGVAVVGLILALGDEAYIHALLKKLIPFFGFIRFPIKYVVLAVFAVPLLAAFGVKAWNRIDDQKNARFRLVSVLGGLLVLIALIIVAAWIRPVPGTTPAVATRNGLMRALWLVILCAALWKTRGKSLSRELVARAAFLLVLAIDITTHVPRQNPTVPNLAYGRLPLDMTHVPQPGESRAMLSPPMQQLLQNAVTADLTALFTGHRRMLFCDANLIDHVPKLNGFFPLYVREADEVNRRLYSLTNVDLPLLQFLGVSQLSDPAQLFAWHERSNAMPLVSAGQSPVFADTKETYEAIFASTFEPRQTVYLPKDAQLPAGGVQSNVCRVISSVAQRRSVSVETDATAPSLVVVAQTFYHPWKALVDGHPTRLWKANYAYQAVSVPAGHHSIELHYNDRLFLIGGITSLGALLFCGLIIFFARQTAIPPI